MTKPLLVTIEAMMRPLGKASVRFGKGRSYTAPTTRNFMHDLGWEAKRVMGPRPPFFLPLSVDMEFHFPIPSSWTRQRVADAGAGHINKPDWDNLGKNVGDSLNGIVWEDDRQIVEGHVFKCWAEYPLVRIVVRHFVPTPAQGAAALAARIAADNNQ